MEALILEMFSGTIISEAEASGFTPFPVEFLGQEKTPHKPKGETETMEPEKTPNRIDIPVGKRGDFLRCEISTYKEKEYFNLRLWYTDKESGELKPTKKGVTVSPEVIPVLILALEKIKKA